MNAAIDHASVTPRGAQSGAGCRRPVRRTLRLRRAASVAGLLLLAGSAGFASGTDLAEFPQAELHIVTSSGDSHGFRIHVARTPFQLARGLMYVDELPPDAGMLFIFDPPRRASMWMKNTLIPLDMLFIRPDGTVANIARDTVPHTLTSHRSQGEVSGVLELNGGTAARLGIEPGDRVQHPHFRDE